MTTGRNKEEDTSYYSQVNNTLAKDKKMSVSCLSGMINEFVRVLK